jgi:DNA polymerase-1
MTPGSPDGSSLGFREVWAVDFEFQAPPGEPSIPLCMCARELISGRMVRVWRDELRRLHRPPFAIDDGSLFVAYYASAELGCFIALGWPLPARILDLYAEFRVATNGLPAVHGNGLLGPLAHYGLGHIDAHEKDAMRGLVMGQQNWSHAELGAILDYCMSDVLALAALLPRMAPTIDWPRALLRGRYMAAVAHMEAIGVPVDVPMHRQLAADWDGLTRRLAQAADREIGVYEGRTFKEIRFETWLAARGIAWPRRPDGALALDRDTFKAQATSRPEHPQLMQLYELRVTLGGMRLTGLQVGADGRNRCLLSPFQSVTGRNQPSNTKCVFGPARWLRGLVKPPEGTALAYIDFASQEIGIAAALSGDERLAEAYSSGDPYLAFAVDARLAPPGATKASHGLLRDRCKALLLGINYGMGSPALATSAGLEAIEARELLVKHRQTYPRFWRWMQDTQDAAILTGECRTCFGWKRQIRATDTNPVNPRSLMNWPMQASGAEMMRIAAIAATEAGISVCLPVHDAFLIEARVGELNATVDKMRGIMQRAGTAVTGGLEIRTEVDQTVLPPARYMDKRGARMWQLVTGLLSDGRSHASLPSHLCEPVSRGCEPTLA